MGESVVANVSPHHVSAIVCFVSVTEMRIQQRRRILGKEFPALDQQGMTRWWGKRYEPTISL